MKLRTTDLLAGERPIVSKRANAVMAIDQQGLSQFAFDQLMSAVGLQSKDAIGGTLNVTSYRLVFISNRFNRLNGSFSIFLPTIRDVRDLSHGAVRKLELSTGTQHHQFVVWGASRLATTLDRLKTGIGREQVPRIVDIAVRGYYKVGQGLKVSETLEAVSAGFAGESLRSMAHRAPNPMEIASALNLSELLDLKAQSNGDADPR